MSADILAQLAALPSKPTAELKALWRELFGTDAPPYNRRFLESRLAYRVQELAFGGLSKATIERLDALAADERLVGRGKGKKRNAIRPIAGTRLVREWKGVEQVVTVREHDYEYQGRPYKSLSSVARAITQSRWNGWTFFGLKNYRKTP
jgi:hypothetical protein